MLIPNTYFMNIGSGVSIWSSSTLDKNNAYETTTILENRIIAAWWSNRWGTYSLRCRSFMINLRREKLSALPK